MNEVNIFEGCQLQNTIFATLINTNKLRISNFYMLQNLIADEYGNSLTNKEFCIIVIMFCANQSDKKRRSEVISRSVSLKYWANLWKHKDAKHEV